MTENRSKERVDVPQLVAVFDSLSDIELGTIVNLHEEGFLLIGSGVVGDNRVYQLRFEFSDPVDDVTNISIGAECLWTNETGSGDKIWAGFHIIDISESDKTIISHLIHQISE